jgi:hypothetical protein
LEYLIIEWAAVGIELLAVAVIVGGSSSWRCNAAP